MPTRARLPATCTQTSFSLKKKPLDGMRNSYLSWTTTMKSEGGSNSTSAGAAPAPAASCDVAALRCLGRLDVVDDRLGERQTVGAETKLRRERAPDFFSTSDTITFWAGFVSAAAASLPAHWVAQPSTTISRFSARAFL